jgi:hypothetical protein
MVFVIYCENVVQNSHPEESNIQGYTMLVKTNELMMTSKSSKKIHQKKMKLN